ncbi:MAG: type II toxin-antitoxin system Phd/YefM family antitoxin [Propionibacteriaceae bacterium]
MSQPPASYNIHDAKTQLSRIIARVEAGDEVILSRNGTPVAKVVPLTGPSRRGRGQLRDRLVLSADWDDESVNADIARHFGLRP